MVTASRGPTNTRDKPFTCIAFANTSTSTTLSPSRHTDDGGDSIVGYCTQRSCDSGPSAQRPTSTPFTNTRPLLLIRGTYSEVDAPVVVVVVVAGRKTCSRNDTVEPPTAKSSGESACGKRTSVVRDDVVNVAASATTTRSSTASAHAAVNSATTTRTAAENAAR